MLTEEEQNMACMFGLNNIVSYIHSLSNQAAYAEENNDIELLDILDARILKMQKMKEYLLSIT